MKILPILITMLLSSTVAFAGGLNIPECDNSTTGVTRNHAHCHNDRDTDTQRQSYGAGIELETVLTEGEKLRETRLDVSHDFVNRETRTMLVGQTHISDLLDLLNPLNWFGSSQEE